jgi:hypothetical protein
MDVRDLLTTAATEVGWEVDLDQLPITCAQVPVGVLTLIEASAAHLAATAGMSVLDQAAASLRTVIDGADDPVGDWEVRLLAAVLDLRDTRRRHTDRTRRRLVAALQALQPEGATWPPEAATTAAGAAGPAELAAALAEVGLHPQPTSGDPTRTAYAARRGGRTVTVTVYPRDDNTAELHVFDHHAVLLWSATFLPGTPPAVLAAAVRDALPAGPPTAPASDPD